MSILQRLFIVIAVLAVIALVIFTGFFAVIIGVIALPFFLLSRKSTVESRSPEAKPNTIDADFQRVEEQPKD